MSVKIFSGELTPININIDFFFLFHFGTTQIQLGAEKATPQYCGAIFLIFFYLTNFKLVQYIPKMAFSCLLILCFLDLMNVWFIKSYQMTKEKYEWMVAPLIVLSSFSVGMLASVALGVAISTFIFVASFYKTGVVKFIDTGKFSVFSSTVAIFQIAIILT